MEDIDVGMEMVRRELAKAAKTPQNEVPCPKCGGKLLYYWVQRGLEGGIVVRRPDGSLRAKTTGTWEVIETLEEFAKCLQCGTKFDLDDNTLVQWPK